MSYQSEQRWNFPRFPSLWFTETWKKSILNWKKYPVGFKLGKNPVHQTVYFKLENCKNPGRIVSKYQKWFMVSWIFPQKWTKYPTLLIWYLRSKFFSFVFWENWGEINWFRDLLIFRGLVWIKAWMPKLKFKFRTDTIAYLLSG